MREEAARPLPPILKINLVLASGVSVKGHKPWIAQCAAAGLGHPTPVPAVTYGRAAYHHDPCRRPNPWHDRGPGAHVAASQVFKS